jgi:hypothetical protein
MDTHLFGYITKLTKIKHGNKLEVIDYKKFLASMMPSLFMITNNISPHQLPSQ